MTTSLKDNPFADLARAAKVRQLRHALQRAFMITAGPVEPETELRAVESYTDAQWGHLEDLARLKSPASETTRSLFIQSLRDNVETWERMQLEAKKGWDL